MAEVTYSAGWIKAGAAALTITVDEPPPPDPIPPKYSPDSVLIRFNLETSIPVQIKIWRTSQIPWREFSLPPGSYEYPSGGPVQNTSDITYIYLATV